MGSEPLAVFDQTPNDVAALYSWANLQGAKYRDFSASRAQVREQARQRVQEAMEAERSRTQEASQTDTSLTRIETEGIIETVRGLPTPRRIAEPAAQPTTPEVIIEKQPAPTKPTPLAAAAAPAPVSQASSTASASPTAESITARWFALNSIFSASIPSPAQARARVPAMAVFSLAGGVGKSSIVAALGRALSAGGENVLLVDTAAFGMLPFFYGAKEQRADVLRTFVAPDAGGGSRVEVLTLDIDRFGPEGNTPEPFTKEILRHASGASRIIIDLATASNMIVRRILRMSPLVLIPVLPDVGSVVSVGAIEQFFQRNTSGSGQAMQPYYLLNQLDENLRLHRDVREVLRNRLGDRLLPFALRSSPLVGEALAEGMTVMDYAPGSPIAEDYKQLAAWARSLASSFAGAARGARWSER